MPNRLAVALLALALCLTACAERAWRTARSADSAADYSRFLREHGDSAHTQEARERLAMARVRSKPSLESYGAFREEFPESELLAELRPYVEEHFFMAARIRGTAAAYRELLEEFPDGAFAARARGNAEYLEQGGFGGRLDALSDFAARHPESDYAAEAQRTVAAAEVRRSSAFRRVGFVLDIPAGTPGADRLARVFSERAATAYSAAQLELVPLASASDPRLADAAAVLTISHREEQVKTKVQGGNITQPGVLARTTVTLEHPGDAEPIWSDAFEFRAAVSEQRTGVSILFGPGSSSFWAEFFVPIASLNTRAAVREARNFQKPAVAVELIGSRAIVLFGDGDVQMLDLGDPASPTLVAEYRRRRDLATFDGVAFGQGRVITYGPDGVEMLRLGTSGLERERAYGREAVGSIVGVESLGNELILAGNRGLLSIGPKDAEVRPLLEHEILGLARSGDRLLFTDGVSLYIGTIDLLKTGRVEGELRMGRGFRPSRVRAVGGSAVVLGERGTAWVDFSVPSRPRLRSRVGETEVGEVRDAIVVGGRLFLLGARGLQVSDPSGERIVDSADVHPRQRLGASGRHLVAVGDKSLQVVDVTPFVSAAGAASPR
jgi:hypothetical protein